VQRGLLRAAEALIKNPSYSQATAHRSPHSNNQPLAFNFIDNYF